MLLTVYSHQQLPHRRGTIQRQDFVELSSNALILASNKVLQKYGFRCTSAEDQLQRIIEKSKSFNSEDMITCLSLE